MKTRSYGVGLAMGLSLAFLLALIPADAQELDYRVLATKRTSTMEEEMNEAANEGFRVSAAMGGETAFGGREGVVIMSRPGDELESGQHHQYKLLATSKTSTMQRELTEAGALGFQYVGQTIFRSAFGGKEVVVILELNTQVEPAAYEYLLLATSKTSTLEKELREAGANHFAVVGMTW